MPFISNSNFTMYPFAVRDDGFSGHLFLAFVASGMSRVASRRDNELALN